MTEQSQPTRDELISIAAEQAAFASEGSFSDRNPTLGKMKRCPYCGHRRREQEVCCNPKYIVTNLADVPKNNAGKRRNLNFAGKTRKNPRLTRVRPPLFETHQKLLDLERQSGYIEHEGISGIMEAQIIRRRKLKARVWRDGQKKSRRINRRVR